MKPAFLHRSACLFMLLLASFGLHAQIPSGYYDSAAGQQGEILKNTLHNIIKGHTVVSYNGLLTAFAYTDCKPNGKIWDIYSNIEYSLSGNCGSYEEEGDCWNREHTWPQSWFKEKAGPKSDLFHVYPTDGYVNGKRSNYPYGEVSHPTYTSGNGSKLGPCATTGYSGTVFEPIDEYKGDIARGFFYMSVRYAHEDSDWGTSGMTDKAQIKDWAMEMLLRWSDEDPVSQKEIDRNNAVYGYQGNRNPFIDHPEYARMIWDPNYTPATSYAITCATGLPHGSVSAPDTAPQGSTVSITTTPAAGYMVDAYLVYKTGDPSITVTVSSNGTFTMPAYPVTVSATFVENNTYYTITLGTVSHGSINASASSAKSGMSITLTATPSVGYSLYSWYVFKEGDMNTTVAVSGNSFVMPAFNVTVMATFAQGGGSSGNYTKVTSAPTDWCGEYLIVYEDGGKAFNGGLETLDASGNTISVTISDNAIASNATTDAAKFTIASMTGGYSIKAANGKYIGNNSNSNSLTASDSPLANTLSFESGNVNIVSSGGAYLRYNSNSGQERFRYFKSGTYTQQQAIQLYKKTVSPTPTHNIHFDKNGGSGTMGDQTVNEFETIALQTNAFTKENHVFDGWNTKADGTGTYYVDEAIVKLLDDLTLYAQWEPLHSITISTGIVHGSVSADVNQALEEQTVTLTATPETGYELDYWVVMDENSNVVTVTENQFEMPASDVTVSAVFIYVGVFEQKYYLVTDANQLVVGRTYLIVNTTAQKALGTTQSTNNRAAVDVTIANNTIESIDNTVCELTLGKDGSSWTLFDAGWGYNGGYLYAASSSNNYLKTQATNNDNGKWSIVIANTGVATIKAQGNNTRNWLRFNSSSTLFSCYESGQSDVCLFIRSEQYDYDHDTTLACLNTFDKHTVRSGVTLTANTVLGTAMLNDPNHLVIEEDAQLRHHTDGLQATVKKSITGYTGQGGWYTLASPMTSLDPEQTVGMVSDDFDLYAYDEAASHEEWRNYKTNAFTLMPGSGYLYAHHPNVVLRMTGTLNNGDFTTTVPLGYSNGTESLKGFNLLGNPTAHEISFSKSDNVSDGYYWIENGDTWMYEIGNTVPVGRGFFVKANAIGQSIVLNPQSRGTIPESQPYLCLSIDGDKVYVKETEGVGMPLLDLNGMRPRLYLNHEGQPYVMLVRNGASELPVQYEAENGTHTLSVSLNESRLDYLHLVDNLTGADIDLLTTPSYTFSAKATDYASRFRLVFKPVSGDENGGNAPFAYYADGEIVITADAHGASLQVVDMMGRVVALRGDISGNVSTSGMMSGVYVLRLITEDNTRTQKIVIR